MNSLEGLVKLVEEKVGLYEVMTYGSLLLLSAKPGDRRAIICSPEWKKFTLAYGSRAISPETPEDVRDAQKFVDDRPERLKQLGAK